MNYHFDEQLPRIGTNSLKWDQYNDPNIIAMSTADMDFKAADNITQALAARAQQGCFNYHGKSASYYETVIRWYKRRHNWDIQRDWLLNIPGIWPALHICLRAFAVPGDNVIIQTPHFYPLNAVINLAGCHEVTNEMILKDGRYELDFEDFERKIIQTRPSVYICINLHNPTGRVFTREELVRLSDICCRYHVLMISDEVHANVTFGQVKHYPLASVSPRAAANSIVITAASKAYNLMDLTYCILVVPDPDIRRRLQTQLTAYSMDFAVNAFSLAGVEAAFSEQTDPWLDALTEYLEQNLAYLEQYMAKNLPQIKVIRPEGSYLVWLDCRALHMTPAEMKEFFLHRAEVGLTWGESYGSCAEGFERINIGCPRKTLEEGLGRIKKAVDSL